MILVDDRPYGQPCPPEKTVRDLARESCEPGAGQGRRMVVAIYCDGQAVADEALDAVLDSPASSFEQLELQTQPVAGLVRTTLEQAAGLVDDAAGVRHAAADLLDRGSNAEAMGELQKLLEIWRQLQASLVFSAEALGLDLDSLEVGGNRLPELVELMKANLADLREAIRNQDAVLIGDLLRYEMEEVFNRWASLLAGLKSSVQSS